MLQGKECLLKTQLLTDSIKVLILILNYYIDSYYMSNILLLANMNNVYDPEPNVKHSWHSMFTVTVLKS